MSKANRKPDPSGPPAQATSRVVAIVKLAIAGLVICAIAFTIAVVDRDGSVSETQADIFDTAFGPKPNQVRFNEALESMGHTEPQVFDLNGNNVYFSVQYEDQNPGDVMRRYQEAFVRRGLNDKVYNTLEEAAGDEGLKTRLTGGITPVKVGADRIVMGGMMTRNIALHPDDLRGDLMAVDDMELFRGHRWIEIFRQSGSDRTTVLAAWSDDDFSYEKMLPSDERLAEGRSVDPDVPSCPGCTRVNHFADKNDPGGYRSNIFVTNMGHHQMVDFYRQAMQRRGWSETEFQRAHEKIRQAVEYDGDAMEKLRFEKHERNLEIFVFPLEQGEIAVQTVLWEQLD